MRKDGSTCHDMWEKVALGLSHLTLRGVGDFGKGVDFFGSNYVHEFFGSKNIKI